ncbi:hypothetical protein D3C72_1472530 [compost metagenome]
MLVVRVGLLASGNSSTRKPLARRYSVMPSTDVTLTAARLGAALPVFWVGAASTGGAARMNEGERMPAASRRAVMGFKAESW